MLAIEFKLDFSGAADYGSLCKRTSVTASQQNKVNSHNEVTANPICRRIINEWAGDCRASPSPWAGVGTIGVIQADSQYVEGAGEDLQGEVEQADSEACGPKEEIEPHHPDTCAAFV